MALLKDFRTIAELFQWLTEERAKNTDKDVLYSRVDGKFKPISYTQFRKETERFALGLASLGLEPKEKVAIISENRPEWVYTDMATLGLGAVDVPLYPSLTSDNIEFILNNSESVGLVLSNKLQLTKVLKIRKQLKFLKFIIILNAKDKPENEPYIFSFEDVQKRGDEYSLKHPHHFSAALNRVSENDVCTIIYTSGTTGEPKGVVLTHKNIVSNVKAALESFPIHETDTFLSFLPLCHIFERMAGYYTGLASGAAIYYAQSIETVATDLLDVKPTVMKTVPRLFERIYSKIQKNVEKQSPAKQKIFNWAVDTGLKYQEMRTKGQSSFTLSAANKLADKVVFSKLRERTGGNLRFFVSGGAALPRELGEFFETIGIVILEGYGLTESSPVIAANRYDNYKFGTVGKPFPGVEVKIAHDGEILARGSNIMQCYYKNEKETRSTIIDGWLHTGDIGVFDAEGFLMITDRKKHLFKTSGGKYIAPTPIENMFLASKYIDQFVLIGDRRMFLSALIVPDYEALREYADSHGIPYSDNNELSQNQQIIALMENELVRFQKNLANYERVRKFALLEQAFTLETGEMTPSLKLKRKVIEERYKHLIEGMYTEK